MLKNKAEIFNITPPNTKDEDKLAKSTTKYQLQPTIEDGFRGYDKEKLISEDDVPLLPPPLP